MRPSLTVGSLLFLSICLSVACAPAIRKSANDSALSINEKAAHTALSMLGKPYKYRGNNPKGFDCSGLVQYSYRSTGTQVPHSTRALRNCSHPTGTDMLTGDLLFFNERGKKASHVGIYLGNDIFVHAPSTGGRVRKDSIQNPYWKKSFLEARRFMELPLTCE
jgi:murein DD-endopeptidase